MAKKYYSTLTKIGLNAIARATTMNEKVKFSKFCIGDAEIHPDVTTTALGHEVWQGSLSSIVVDENNPNWIVLTCIISATVGGFTIREVGIKDEDGNLLAVASYPETYKPILAEGAGKDLIVRVILEVSNTECVELKIDPTVSLATRSDLEAIENKKADKEEVKKLEEKVEKVEQKVTEGVENLDIAGKQIEFVEASTRTLPQSGDSIKKIVAKITKYLKDLKTVAFTGKYTDLTGLPTSFPPAAHNHDDRYLGKLAKAADSDKLDGHDSSHFATAEKLQEVFQYAVDGKQTLINEINKALGSDSGLTSGSTWEDIIKKFKMTSGGVDYALVNACLNLYDIRKNVVLRHDDIEKWGFGIKLKHVYYRDNMPPPNPEQTSHGSRILYSGNAKVIIFRPINESQLASSSYPTVDFPILDTTQDRVVKYNALYFTLDQHSSGGNYTSIHNFFNMTYYRKGSNLSINQGAFPVINGTKNEFGLNNRACVIFNIDGENIKILTDAKNYQYMYNKDYGGVGIYVIGED